MTYGRMIDYDAARTATHFAMAREVLRRENATPDQITAAIDVLSASTDWKDVMLVREMRIGLFALTGAELRTPESLSVSQDAANFIPDFRMSGGSVLVLIASCILSAGVMIGLLVSRMGWL